MSLQLFETMMGREYYESTMPRIAASLESIAVELKRANDLAEAAQAGATPKDSQ